MTGAQGEERPTVAVAQRHVLEAVAGLQGRGVGALAYAHREAVAGAVSSWADTLAGQGHAGEAVLFEALGELVLAIAEDLQDREGRG